MEIEDLLSIVFFFFFKKATNCYNKHAPMKNLVPDIFRLFLSKI